MFNVELTPAFIWILVAVVFATIELATLGSLTIWFAAGAVAAAISSSFVSNVFIQFLIFFLVSIASLIFIRPYAEKYFKLRKRKMEKE